jgi:hypothetical protein
MPFDAARRAGEQQQGQNDQGRGDDRKKKRPDKTHSAVDAAKSRQSAENEVDDGFEHGLVLSFYCCRVFGEWSHSPIGWHAPLPYQELVAAAPEPPDGVERESHISFWDLMNSR